MTQLVRVTRGVWRPPDALPDLAARCAAVLSVAPEGSVVAGITAARLHGLWLPAAESDEAIELVLRGDAEEPSKHAGSRRREIRGRRRRLCPDEVLRLGGFDTTGLARTWVDLAASLSLPDLVAAGDSALRGSADDRVGIEQLEVAVVRAAGRRGVARAREAVGLLDGRSRSRPESHLRVGLVTRGLPRPQVNQKIYDEHGQWLGEPDLSYDDVRLAIEYNGALHASQKRMRSDLTRGVDIGLRGAWHSIGIGPAEVFGRMDQVALWVRALRRERAGIVR